MVPILDHKRLVIAEVAQTHDGSLGLAHAFIDAVANAGADAVKFQTHIADAESHPSEPWRIAFSYEDESRYAYWKRMEFTEPQWHGLKRHADERGLVFLSTPFSLDALELLSHVGVPAWKVGSGEVTNIPLLDRMADTGLPVWLSSGMSYLHELDAAVARLRAREVPFAVFQCTSKYPTPPEEVGVNLIPLFRERYGCPVGLSDHSGSIYPGLTAAALGARMIEVHVTLSSEMFGPDVPVSLTMTNLRRLVEGVRMIDTMEAHPVDKDAAALALQPVRKLFTKSVVLRESLPAGTVLREEHLSTKKPGTGIPAARLDELVGRRLARLVQQNTLLSEDDLEPTSASYPTPAASLS